MVLLKETMGGSTDRQHFLRLLTSHQEFIKKFLNLTDKQYKGRSILAVNQIARQAPQSQIQFNPIIKYVRFTLIITCQVLKKKSSWLVANIIKMKIRHHLSIKMVIQHRDLSSTFKNKKQRQDLSKKISQKIITLMHLVIKCEASN